MSVKAFWRNATEWVLARIVRPVAWNKSIPYAIVDALVLGIGVADYAVGVRISLAILYLAPLTLAVAWLDWRAGVWVALMSSVARILGNYLWIGTIALPEWIWWNTLTYLAICLIMVGLLNAFLSLYRQLEQRVEERTMALQEAAKVRQELERELLEIGSRERNLLGQELHDDVCQHLVGTALAAKVLAKRLAEQENPAARHAQDIVHWIEEGAARARHLASGFLLANIAPDQLGEKLAALAAESSTASVPCRFRQEGKTMVADGSAAAQLFRIAQEAMRNALKHAQPQHVHVALVGDEDAICLIVEDDGRGLPSPEMRGPGMGLRIMSHRATNIGATLTVATASSRGTRVICHVPHLKSDS